MLRIISITTLQISRPAARRTLATIRNSSTTKTGVTVQTRRIGPKITKRKPQNSKKKFKREEAEETPWPRNWQIAGFSAVAVSIPLSFLSAVAEQPYLRSLLTGDRPQDDTWANALVKFLRDYWTENGLFEGETADQVAKDLELHRLMDFDVPTRMLTEASTSSSFGDEFGVLRSLSATVPTDVGSVSKAFYGGDHAVEGTQVFVEFMDVANDSNEDVGIEQNGGLISDSGNNTDVVFSDEIPALNNQAAVDDEDRKLLQLMQGFSLWHHWPSTADENDGATQAVGTDGSKMSAEEIRISELEWKEAQLQMQMIDPNCTREIDAMEKELIDVKRELRSRKGGWTAWLRRK